MHPKKKVNSTLANCWVNPEPSTFASIPPPSTATSSTSSDPENPESNPNKRKRVGSSYIWNHGTKIIRSDGSSGWKCIHCRHVLPVSSTSNQRYHLRETHKITDPEHHANDQPTTLDRHILRPFRVDVARKLLVEYHVEHRLPFLAIDSPALQRLLEYLDPRSVKALTTANTLRADCIRYFEIAKNTIINILSSAMSRIHLTWDLWTSPNFKAMIAITTHWTDKNWKVQSTLIAIREIEGDHDGENISQIIHAVIKEFEIVDRIGYFTGDNASNNDTAMKCLNRRILEEGGVGFDVGERRLRCFAHDMKIAVKGLLFGPKVKELETYEATADVSDEEKAEWMKAKWRAFGAIGKLHNIVKYIRISPKRCAGFKTILRSLEKLSVKVPVMDNDTRWGSVATMVEYGLENRDGIDIYCREQTALEADMLSEEDWVELQTVRPSTIGMIDITGYQDLSSVQKVDETWSIKE